MKIIKLILFLPFFLLIVGSFKVYSVQASVYPADINDLQVVNITDTTISLTWTAVGDDSFFGYADHYDMRISKNGIAPIIWDSYDRVLGLPTPGAPGVKKEQFTVTGLSPSTNYTIAVKAVDKDGNKSLDFTLIDQVTLGSSTSQNILKNLNFFPKLEQISSASKMFSITIFKPGTSNSIFTFSKKASSAGGISLPVVSSLIPGIYDVGVKTDKYLSKKTKSVNLKSNFNITLAQMDAGDVNSDGIINSLDWSLLSSNWFTSNSSYDLTGDNFINSLDWSIMSKNWFLTGDF